MTRIDDLLRDLRYALRLLASNPGFTAVALLTLALGIGANVTVFSVVDAVLFHPLPYRDAGGLVALLETDRQGNAGSVSDSDFQDFSAGSRSFEGMAALAFGGGGTLIGGDRPERVLGVRVSTNFFPLLGAAPVVGRNFLPDEERASAGQVVILSYGLWRRRFGGDRSIVGKELKFGDGSAMVVGILPPNFWYLSRRIELWRPPAP